jgi:Uma2 family endonuclease
MSATPSFGFPPPSFWRISVPQYHQMIACGILKEDDPVELLEGLLVAKMPKHPPHCNAAGAIVEILIRLHLAGYSVRGQNPITTSDSEPEPDVCVVRGSRKDFVNHHPGPRESALVVEVADSSLAHDRGLKKRVYARAEVPVYWIVNLEQGQVEVYSQPFDAGGKPDYGTVKLYSIGQEVPLVLDGHEIAQLPVAQLLGE